MRPADYVDVEYALTSTLTPEELAFVFSREFEWHDEHYLVQGIKKHLRTPEQKAKMDFYDFTIEDMLNGRVEGTEAQATVTRIFSEWNTKIGHNEFHF